MTPAEAGRLISRARKRRNMTQRELAQAAGVGVRTVVGWERGESFPRKNPGLVEDLLGISLTAVNGTTPLPTDPVERQLYDLAVVDGGADGAWAVVEEYRRRRRRTA